MYFYSYGLTFFIRGDVRFGSEADPDINNTCFTFTLLCQGRELKGSRFKNNFQGGAPKGGFLVPWMEFIEAPWWGTKIFLLTGRNKWCAYLWETQANRVEHPIAWVDTFAFERKSHKRVL